MGISSMGVNWTVSGINWSSMNFCNGFDNRGCGSIDDGVESVDGISSVGDTMYLINNRIQQTG